MVRLIRGFYGVINGDALTENREERRGEKLAGQYDGGWHARPRLNWIVLFFIFSVVPSHVGIGSLGAATTYSFIRFAFLFGFIYCCEFATLRVMNSLASVESLIAHYSNSFAIVRAVESKVQQWKSTERMRRHTV